MVLFLLKHLKQIMIIRLTKNDVEAMLAVMNKFPQDKNYQIEYDTTPGLGYTLAVVVDVSIKGQPGEFKIDIATPEMW